MWPNVEFRFDLPKTNPGIAKSHLQRHVATRTKKGPDKGYTKKEGIDYEETFLPVAMLKCIRILLSIAAHYDYEIWKMDVKTAFLNGNLEEKIYMMQLEGFIAKNQEHMVCKLKRSI